MRRAAAPTSNASLREIVSRNEMKRRRGAEVIVFSPIGARRHKKDHTRVRVYPAFLSKTFTMGFADLE
jgi:hypothetical protein